MPAELDPVIHPVHRLQICALLANADEMEFALLREELGVSDSVLSKQLKYLDEASYLKVRKVPSSGRPRSWYSLSRAGLAAFHSHLAALRSIASLDT